MHWREAGRLTFRKQGNAFLYSEEDVQRHERAAEGVRLKDEC